MSDIIIREVTKDIWTFSKPFSRFGLFPIGGRSTAIKLKNGGVWVLASTPLTTETKSTIDKLGTVKYICGADSKHWLFLGEFKKAYADAKLYAVKEVVGKADKNLQFDGVWGDDGPDSFENGEIKACHFTGFRNKDVAFFHPASKTVVQADLLFNLPGNEQYSKTKGCDFPGTSNLTPFRWFHEQYVKGQCLDKDWHRAMKRDAKTVAEWDFDRIIPCHGDVIETGGNKAWKYAYKSFLD